MKIWLKTQQLDERRCCGGSRAAQLMDVKSTRLCGSPGLSFPPQTSSEVDFRSSMITSSEN